MRHRWRYHRDDYAEGRLCPCGAHQYAYFDHGELFWLPVAKAACRPRK